MANTKIGVPPLQRIQERSSVVGSGCREWIGSRTTDGYGKLAHLGKTWRAHRLMWVCVHGPIPPRRVICHRCDNRGCVEISHLFLGTQSENIRDAVAKGRVISPFSPDHPKHVRSKSVRRAGEAG